VNVSEEIITRLMSAVDTQDSDGASYTDKLLLFLTPMQERILRLRYGVGTERQHTQVEIGKEFDLTGSGIAAIEHRALRRLRWAINKGIADQPLEALMARRQQEAAEQRLVDAGLFNKAARKQLAREKQRSHAEETRKRQRVHARERARKQALRKAEDALNRLLTERNVVNAGIDMIGSRGWFWRTLLPRTSKLSGLRKRLAVIEQALPAAEIRVERLRAKTREQSPGP
jgi:hypothetical protein